MGELGHGKADEGGKGGEGEEESGLAVCAGRSGCLDSGGHHLRLR